MRSLIQAVCFVPFLLAPAFGQHPFSFGVKGGVPFSDAFADTSTHGIDTALHSFSNSKEFVIGPFAELALPLGFSVEADALYRPLNLTTDATLFPRPSIRDSFDIQSWEFPILAKYRLFQAPVIRPYVEAGPVFRAVGSQGSYLSNAGFSLGGGIDIKILRIRVTPEIRYSRWGKDATVTGFTASPSNLNQAEFLLGLAF